MLTISDLWESYLEKVLVPCNPCETQIIETKKAFYAGSVGLFSVLNSFADLPERAQI